MSARGLSGCEDVGTALREESARGCGILKEVVTRRARETRESKGMATDLFWFLFELVAFGLILAVTFFVGYSQGIEFALKGG